MTQDLHPGTFASPRKCANALPHQHRGVFVTRDVSAGPRLPALVGN